MASECRSRFIRVVAVWQLAEETELGKAAENVGRRGGTGSIEEIIRYERNIGRRAGG